MKKEGLEERISRWANNCIWSGILAGSVISPIVYGRVSNSEPGVYAPSDEKTLLVVLGSFIISGIIVGSLYSFIRRKYSSIRREKSVYSE
ncbi:hypothetical protein HYT26_01285 [Candidatus Pacearchaeota archaeon]|nr:hypothetical protein [Candidatus Pacearchaeota archaeon]